MSEVRFPMPLGSMPLLTNGRSWLAPTAAPSNVMTKQEPPLVPAARATGKDKVMIPPEAFYLTAPECIIVLFDSGDPAGAKALRDQRDLWQMDAHSETLSESCSALIIRPGGAGRLVA